VLVEINKVYSLGDHRIICGDCRNCKVVKEAVAGSRINLIVADPPYGVSYVETKEGFGNIKVNKVIQNDSFKNEDEYKVFTIDWLNAVKPYLASKNSVYIFNSDKMIFALRSAMEEAGFRFAQLLIWVKSNQVIGRRDYLAKHELIAYGWYGAHKFLKSKDKSVIFYPKPQSSPIHPTSKPVGLIRHLILNSTRIGDTVYDPFGGSGSTLVACEQTRRKCVMIEIDSDYIGKIINRYKRLKGDTNNE